MIKQLVIACYPKESRFAKRAGYLPWWSPPVSIMIGGACTGDDGQMDFDAESAARTSGLDPVARRLQLGLSAIIGRSDGSVIEVFPDGTETVLAKRSRSGNHHDADLGVESGEQGD